MVRIGKADQKIDHGQNPGCDDRPLPSPAGGPSDIAARIIGDRLWKVLGQASITDNRGVANGIGVLPRSASLHAG